MTSQQKFCYKSSSESALNISSKVIELCSKKTAAHMGGALSITDFFNKTLQSDCPLVFASRRI
jgi:hypothetical protein